MQRIFLDNSATTPIDPAVLAAMTEALADNYGNPSSIHAEGRRARAAIEAARKTVAQHLNCSIGEIFFTSGGTEANNMALKNAVRDLGVTRIVSSPIEHHCVLHSLDTIAAAGAADIIHVPLDKLGRVKYEELERILQTAPARPGKTLVSLMHANNEVGTLLDLEQTAAICQQNGAYFHCDTVQTIGYYPIDLAATPVSFLSGSAHKFNGPKGVGFLYVNGDNIIKPYLDGGAQERNMRGGTENLYGIVGLAAALQLAQERMDHTAVHIRQLREHFIAGLHEHFPGVEFNGDTAGGHFKVLSVAFPPSDRADLLLLSLDMKGIAASGGSACSSGIDVGSHVVAQLRPGSLHKTVRFSFGHQNTLEEVDRVLSALREILPVEVAH